MIASLTSYSWVEACPIDLILKENPSQRGAWRKQHLFMSIFRWRKFVLLYHCRKVSVLPVALCSRREGCHRGCHSSARFDGKPDYSRQVKHPAFLTVHYGQTVYMKVKQRNMDCHIQMQVATSTENVHILMIEASIIFSCCRSFKIPTETINSTLNAADRRRIRGDLMSLSPSIKLLYVTPEQVRLYFRHFF